MSTIKNIDNNLLDPSELFLINALLFGSNSFDKKANINVLNATIEYLLKDLKFPSTKRVEEPLFQWSEEIFKQGYVSAYSVSIAIVTRLFFVDFFFLGFFFIRGYPYNFRYLVVVPFNFTVHDIICIKINKVKLVTKCLN